MIWTGETLQVTVRQEAGKFVRKNPRKVFAIDLQGDSTTVLVADDSGTLRWVVPEHYTVVIVPPPAKPAVVAVRRRR